MSEQTLAARLRARAKARDARGYEATPEWRAATELDATQADLERIIAVAQSDDNDAEEAWQEMEQIAREALSKIEGLSK